MTDLASHPDKAEQRGGRSAPGEQATGNLPSPETVWRSGPLRLIILCGIVLAGAVIAATTGVLLHLRDRDIANSEREMNNVALILAEQIDRSFQSIELIQTNVIEWMQSRSVVSAEEYRRQMSGNDIHQMLKEKIGPLPYIDAIVLTDAQGKLINFSRSWPVPDVKIPDQDPASAFTAKPRLISVVSKPLRSPATGNWIITISRKVTGPHGEFLGVVTGVVTLQYFEHLFEAITTTPNGSLALYSRDGTLLVRYPREEAAIGRSFSESEVFSNILLKSDHGTVRKTSVIDGVERLVSARSLGHYPIAVVATTTLADALANWRSEALAFIGTAMIVGIVIGGVVLVGVWTVGKKLREQNLQQHAALSNISQGLAMFDSTATLIVCNDRFREMYNLPAGTVTPGCTIRDIFKYMAEAEILSGSVEELLDRILKSVADGKTTTRVLERRDGHAISVVNQPIAGGGWVSTHEDITERKYAEDILRRTKAFFNTVLENVPLPITVKSVRGGLEEASERRFTLVNRAAEALFGIPRSQIIGKNLHEVFLRDYAELTVRHDNEALQSSNQIRVYEHPFKTSNSDNRYITTRKVVIRDDDGNPEYILSLLEDVTERKRIERYIARMAHYDTLTDLPNRAAFNAFLAAALDKAARSGKQFTILSVDLDRFKEANDSHGHAVGDMLLREAAERMKAVAGEAFLARIGGDEFTLLVPDGGQPAATSLLAKRVLATFADDFEVEGARLRLGATIGGAIYPKDGGDAKTLMINADIALYRAKTEARGSMLFFEPEMSIRLHERRTIEEDLRSAIGRGELFLHYQPQKTISDETIGFEALARWQSQKRGMVSPDVFIPIAEESNLIVEIGEWVLREACREAASWPRPLTIAVNISPIQFRQGDLPRLVHSVLLETGIAPSRLELEITEGVLIDDFSHAVSILRRLKSLGVRIALDDFGTGYSFLSYLHSFSFDKIKIDRAFIGGLEYSGSSKAIVRAVIGLGHNLGVPIIAEGVETKAQHAVLHEEGCDEVQGYLAGRPLPIEDYALLIGRQAMEQQRAATAG